MQQSFVLVFLLLFCAFWLLSVCCLMLKLLFDWRCWTNIIASIMQNNSVIIIHVGYVGVRNIFSTHHRLMWGPKKVQTSLLYLRSMVTTCRNENTDKSSDRKPFTEQQEEDSRLVVALAQQASPQEVRTDWEPLLFNISHPCYHRCDYDGSLLLYTRTAVGSFLYGIRDWNQESFSEESAQVPSR